MASLQERRDAQTRSELASIAIELFAANGFVETTMADVAEAAGVSRRTAYRHFPNKEDLIFIHAVQWRDVFDETIATRGPTESTEQLCHRAVLAVAEEIEKSQEELRAGYGVIAATPTLRSRYARTNRDWLERYFTLISADLDANDVQAMMRASILSGALVGGTDRAVIEWFLHPRLSIVELTQKVLLETAAMWPNECRNGLC